MADVIRRIEQSQLGECLEVIHRSFAPVAGQFHLTPLNCPTYTAFITLERLIFESGNGVEFYGIYDGTELVGVVGLDRRENEVQIKHLCVLPEKQNMNFGTRLMEYAAREAAKMGYRRISAGIIDENERLKKFYMRRGYTEIEKRSFTHLPFVVCYMVKE